VDVNAARRKLQLVNLIDTLIVEGLTRGTTALHTDKKTNLHLHFQLGVFG